MSLNKISINDTTTVNTGIVYDISKSHNGATYADLDDALGTGGLNVPLEVREGGMSVKFIQTGDNKYVQYRSMSNEFTTDTTQWAISDESVYVENPEFISCYCDADSRLLWWIYKDGSVDWVKGVPAPIQEELKKLEQQIKGNIEGYESIVARVTANEASITAINDALSKKLDFEEIDDNNLVKVLADNDNKIVEAITANGEKYINTSIIIKGNVKHDIVNSEEYISLMTTVENKIIWGITNKGEVLLPIIKSTAIEDINEKITYIIENISELSKNKKLEGNTLWTLWDSLGTNTWQNDFVKLSGVTFYPALNVNDKTPISYGGTSSHPSVDNGTQARAINLASLKNDYNIDVIIVENINDTYLANTNLGDITDKSFMRAQKLTIEIDSVINSYEDAIYYWENNAQEILLNIPETKRLNGTIISIPYMSGNEIRGSRVYLNGMVTKEGDVTLTLGSNYAVHVTEGMNAQDVINLFLQYSFGAGWTDIDNGDGSFSIFYYTSTTLRVTSIDGGDTGITGTIEDTTGTGAYFKYFTGELTEWMDSSKWVDNISLYATYKALCKYLIEQFPLAKIYWAIPNCLSADFSSNSYKDENGNWSEEKYREGVQFKEKQILFNAQRTVANFYHLPILEIEENSGISIGNIESFYTTNNVHPKAEGYKRFAETILNLI